MPHLTVCGYIAAFPSVLKNQIKNETYQLYITDCLRLLTENTAKSVREGESAEYIRMRYFELINPKPQDTRTGEQIVAEVIEKAGLTITKGGETH